MGNLGRVERIDPRSVWRSEARDFTPWLLANPDAIAETLGIDLELEAAEHPVGGFSADLIGHDLTNEAVLIVENQLAATDHGHLGQIITYAAGTEASTVIWIATEFREEHRQALIWLNAHTSEDLRFFGLEVGLIRIGESPAAPQFKVVAQPNDWQRRVRDEARLGHSPRARLYQKFWTLYLAEVHKRHPNWTRATKPSAESWMTFTSPIRGTAINPSFAMGGRLRHEIYIDSGDGARNLEIFRELQAHREAMEAAYGRPLEFEELPDARACRIAEYAQGDVTDEKAHSRYVEWFVDAGERMRRALGAVSLPQG